MTVESTLTEIQVSIARIEEGIGHIKESGSVSTTRLNDHSGRLQSLELTRGRQKGMLASLAGLTVFIGAAFKYFKF